jgi:hypothetical protein
VLEVGGGLGHRLEGVDVAVGAQRGEQQADHPDVGSAVDGDGVHRQPPAEQGGELTLVQAAGAFELADDARVGVAPPQGERLPGEWPEGHGLVSHPGL